MPAYKSAEFIEDTDDELEIIGPTEEGAAKPADIGGPDSDQPEDATVTTSKASASNKRRRTMPDKEGKFIP